MNPKTKLYEFLFVGGVIFTFVIGIVLLSSSKDLSITTPEAAGPSGDIFNVTPSNTMTPSAAPTLLRAKNQDVPLKVLGSKEIPESSYLYTELTSKGLITNITATKATILWLTEAPQQTSIRYGKTETILSRTYFNKNPVYIHAATLENLTPNSLYYYSGHAPITETFTTGPSLPQPPTLPSIGGTLTGGSGTCLIRTAISRDSEVSAYITQLSPVGTWDIPLTGLRSADYRTYYKPKVSDTIEIDVLCVSENKQLFSGVKRLNYGTAVHTDIDVKVHQNN